MQAATVAADPGRFKSSSVANNGAPTAVSSIEFSATFKFTFCKTGGSLISITAILYSAVSNKGVLIVSPSVTFRLMIYESKVSKSKNIPGAGE